MKVPIAAVLALAAPAACAQHRAADAPLPLAAITVEVKSWGRPVSSWSIDAAGNGRYSAPEPGVHDAERIVTRGFAAGDAGFRELRGLLGPAEARAGGELPCPRRITDQHYGSVRWQGAGGSARALAFDMGCMSVETGAVLRRIEQADARVAAWAAAGPVVETRKVEW